MGSQELDSKKKPRPACSSHDNLFFFSTKIQENHCTRDPNGNKDNVGWSSSSMVIQASSSCSIATDDSQETERDLKGKKVVMNPQETERNTVENENRNEIPNNFVSVLNRKRKEPPTQIAFSILTDQSKKDYPNEVSRKLTQEQRIKNLGFYSHQDVEEERRLGVCTQLKLYENPWKITKKLKLSDVNSSARLLLCKDVVGEHITQFWDTETVSRIESQNGVRVRVWDCDTKTDQELVFKRWVKSSHSYVFNNEWSSQFVRRRGLKVDDEIGLFWDTYTSRFLFRVLVRAPRDQPTRP